MGARLVKSIAIVLIGLLLMYVCWPLYDSLGTSLTTEEGIYASYSTDYDDDSVQIYTGHSSYQLFTTGTSSFTVTEVLLRLYRIGTPGTVTCTVRTVAGGAPSATILTTATAVGSSFTTDIDGLWVTFNVTDVTLSASTQYAIMLAVSGDALNCVTWKIDSSTPTYVGGEYGSV